jgi:hypothetical protein
VASLAAMEHLLSCGVLQGFTTPAKAVGSQFILSISETDLRSVQI